LFPAEGQTLPATDVLEENDDIVDQDPEPHDVVEAFDHQRAQVDVLFVIDNSCSMFEQQVMLAEAFPSMVDVFEDSGLDWHVGVISTDMDSADEQGKLHQSGVYRWIDETVPYPNETFVDMASMGTMGSWNERTRDAIHSAVEVHDVGFNAGFRRTDAQIAVIAISDEDDTSDMLLDDFVIWMNTLAEEVTETTYNAIVVPQNSVCVGGVEPGWDHLSAVAKISGVVEDICASEYDQALIDVTDLWWSSPWYFLAEEPLEDVEVRVTQPFTPIRSLEPEEYVYDGDRNAIRITRDFRPAIGSEFELVYRSR
jgi:hypothetical protein